MRSGARHSISVELQNGADVDLKSVPPRPIHLSYHWMGTNGQYLEFGGERTRLKPDARAGSATSYEMSISSPEKPGSYLLRVTLIQESVRWFDQAPTKVYCDLPVECVPNTDQM
jgi:hypothetical protein